MSSRHKKQSSAAYSESHVDKTSSLVSSSGPRPTLASHLRTSRISINGAGRRQRNVDGEPIGDRQYHPGLKRFAVTGAVSGEDAVITSLRGTWSAMTGSSTALPKSSGELLEHLAGRTGWSRNDADRSYKETIRYRCPIPDDLDAETWMDIVNRKGKPWIRNIGLLRYLGSVDFRPGLWAGIEIYGKPIKAGNDGSVGKYRYFDCKPGLGLFVEDTYCRKSFIQRARQISRTLGSGYGSGDYETRLRFLDDMGVWQVPDEEETDSHRSTPVIPHQRESPVKLASVEEEEEEEEPEEEKPISSVARRKMYMQMLKEKLMAKKVNTAKGKDENARVLDVVAEMKERQPAEVLQEPASIEEVKPLGIEQGQQEQHEQEAQQQQHQQHHQQHQHQSQPLPESGEQLHQNQSEQQQQQHQAKIAEVSHHLEEVQQRVQSLGPEQQQQQQQQVVPSDQSDTAQTTSHSEPARPQQLHQAEEQQLQQLQQQEQEVTSDPPQTVEVSHPKPARPQEEAVSRQAEAEPPIPPQVPVHSVATSRQAVVELSTTLNTPIQSAAATPRPDNNTQILWQSKELILTQQDPATSASSSSFHARLPHCSSPAPLTTSLRAPVLAVTSLRATAANHNPITIIPSSTSSTVLDISGTDSLSSFSYSISSAATTSSHKRLGSGKKPAELQQQRQGEGPLSPTTDSQEEVAVIALATSKHFRRFSSAESDFNDYVPFQQRVSIDDNEEQEAMHQQNGEQETMQQQEQSDALLIETAREVIASLIPPSSSSYLQQSSSSLIKTMGPMAIAAKSFFSDPSFKQPTSQAPTPTAASCSSRGPGDTIKPEGLDVTREARYEIVDDSTNVTIRTRRIYEQGQDEEEEEEGGGGEEEKDTEMMAKKVEHGGSKKEDAVPSEMAMRRESSVFPTSSSASSFASSPIISTTAQEQEQEQQQQQQKEEEQEKQLEQQQQQLEQQQQEQDFLEQQQQEEEQQKQLKDQQQGILKQQQQQQEEQQEEQEQPKQEEQQEQQQQQQQQQEDVSGCSHACAGQSSETSSSVKPAVCPSLSSASLWANAPGSPREDLAEADHSAPTIEDEDGEISQSSNCHHQSQSRQDDDGANEVHEIMLEETPTSSIQNVDLPPSSAHLFSASVSDQEGEGREGQESTSVASSTASPIITDSHPIGSSTSQSAAAVLSDQEGEEGEGQESARVASSVASLIVHDTQSPIGSKNNTTAAAVLSDQEGEEEEGQEGVSLASSATSLIVHDTQSSIGSNNNTRAAAILSDEEGEEGEEQENASVASSAASSISDSHSIGSTTSRTSSSKRRKNKKKTRKQRGEGSAGGGGNQSAVPLEVGTEAMVASTEERRSSPTNKPSLKPLPLQIEPEEGRQQHAAAATGAGALVSLTNGRSICFSPKATQVVFVNRQDSFQQSEAQGEGEGEGSQLQRHLAATSPRSVKPLASGLGCRMEVSELELDTNLALPKYHDAVNNNNSEEGGGGEEEEEGEGGRDKATRHRRCQSAGASHDDGTDGSKSNKSRKHRRCRTGAPPKEDDPALGAKVELTELEHYAQAARDYLEDHGVETSDATEAAAFTKRVLYCRLNNIDPTYGTTALLGPAPESGKESEREMIIIEKEEESIGDIPGA